MDRRTFVATAGAAAIAGALPAIAQDAPVIAQDLPLSGSYNYAMLLTYQDVTLKAYHDITLKGANVDALTIAQRGRITLAPGWTVERAMTDIWPQPGKWWTGDRLDAFFALSYHDKPEGASHVDVQANAAGPADRSASGMVAIVNQDGSVEFGPAFDGDESDRAAWREMGRMFVKLAALQLPSPRIPSQP